MMHPAELREKCAARLLAGVDQATHLKAFLGLDGFVDEIIHVVDKRHDADSYQRLSTMDAYGRRISAAAGRSTNIELVVQRTKLGGNGPIMANALARLGIKVTFVGTLGYPNLHPVFHEFAHRAEVHSIAEPGHTDALEFEDGKVMLTKTAHFNQITWDAVQTRVGRDLFLQRFASADLVGFVNWTMIPHMSNLWESLLREACPSFSGPRRKIFFDLADPEKRSKADILRAMHLIEQFQEHLDVILGLNEKEAAEIGQALGVNPGPSSEEGLVALALALHRHLPVFNLVIHPVTFALAVSQGTVSLVHGPFVEKPLITTGAGDHFNSGYCLGKLLGMEDSLSLLTGVTTSGFYVRNGFGPAIHDLAEMLRNWPHSA